MANKQVGVDKSRRKAILGGSTALVGLSSAAMLAACGGGSTSSPVAANSAGTGASSSSGSSSGSSSSTSSTSSSGSGGKSGSGSTSGSASSATTITGTSTGIVSATGPGYDGTITVSSAGVLVNGAGTPVQLRGANMPMDSQIMGGWPTQPFGAYAGAGGPPWPTYASWKSNVFRITINVGAWLNLNMGVLTGSASSPAWTGAQVAGDPGLTYKNAIGLMIAAARQIGCYVIIDAHWTAPAFTFNGVTNYMGSFGQPMFMDVSTCEPFWCAGEGQGPIDATGSASTGIVAYALKNWVNPATGNINDLIFELFNEPYLDGESVTCNSAQGGTGASLTIAQTMRNGGWVSAYCNQNVGTGRGGTGLPTNLSSNYVFPQWWQALGYQQALNGIRALGATNVLLVNGQSWSSDQSMISQIYPTDTLSPPQVGTGWHAYSTNGSTMAGGSYAAATANINGTGGIGHPIPVLVTEYGNYNGGSGTAAPQPDVYMNNMQAWMDSMPVGSAGGTSWEWPMPASYGAGGTQTQQETILGAPVKFTASISNGSSAAGTTMTVTSGSGIEPGLVLTSGAADRTVVWGQISGTTGGPGEYLVSISQKVASTSLTGQMWLPNNGQGMTHYNWMTTHA